MKSRIRILVPLLLVAAAVAAFLLWPESDGSGDLFASGTVEATEADLGFQVPGRVDEIASREGDDVARGATLARLDMAEPRAARDAAAAQLSAAQARLRELETGARPEEVTQARVALRSAEQRFQDARRDAVRARALFEGGAVSRQAMEKAETALEVAEAVRDQARETLSMVEEGPRTETIEAQRAGVEQARAQLARAESVLDNGEIRAPFAGVITVRHREPGETVSPGAPVLTLLDPADRWVRIYVPEDQVGRVRIGMAAEIASDTWPDRTYAGEVVFIASEAEFTPRNVQTQEERTKLVYAVKVRITGDADFELKPGIPADVTLLEREG